MSTYRQFFGGGITNVESFTGNGVATIFNLAATVTAVKHMIVSVNGLIQQPTVHYTLSSGDLVFSEAPPNNAAIVVQVLNTSRALDDIPATWDDSRNVPSIWTLDTTKRIATKDANSTNAPVFGAANSVKSGGKWYCEVYLDVWSLGTSKFGALDPSLSDSQDLGTTTTSWGYLSDGLKYYNNTSSSYGGAWADDMTLMMAVDKVNGKIWWGRNGTWEASGDPAAGTNAAFENALLTSTDLIPAFSTFASGRVIELRASVTACVYTPPTGFLYWTNTE